jgi:endonuclease YncB( thermonuclease family)
MTSIKNPERHIDGPMAPCGTKGRLPWRRFKTAIPFGCINLSRTLLLLLSVLAAFPASAQAPPGSGKAPVPNVRGPLPQADPTPAAPAPPPVSAAARPRSAAPAEAERQTPGAAGVGRVVDGDTLRVEGRTYRLWGIDAPELIQVCQRDGQAYACGREAAAYLRTLLVPDPTLGDSAAPAAPQQLVCTPRTSDQYGRTAALCRLGDKDLGAEMVRAGWALNLTRQGSDYAAEEDDAREARRGLWGGNFDTPWEWRAKRLGE